MTIGFRRLSLCLLLAIALGCSGPTEPGPPSFYLITPTPIPPQPSVDGAWTGSYKGQGCRNDAIETVLSQSGSHVQGGRFQVLCRDAYAEWSVGVELDGQFRIGNLLDVRLKSDNDNDELLSGTATSSEISLSGGSSNSTSKLHLTR